MSRKLTQNCPDCADNDCTFCLENAQTCDGCYNLTSNDDITLAPYVNLSTGAVEYPCYCPDCLPTEDEGQLPIELSAKDLIYAIT